MGDNKCLCNPRLDQASALFDRLKSSGAITASEYRALKGEVYVCSVAAPWNANEDEGEDTSRDFLGWWILRLARAYFPGADFSACIRPLGLFAWGMTLTEDVEYSAEECERLSDTAHDWEGSMEKVLLPERRLSERGKAVCLLLTRGSGLPNEMEVMVRPRLYLSAAECYRKGVIPRRRFVGWKNVPRSFRGPESSG